MAMYITNSRDYLRRYYDYPLKWVSEVMGIDLWSVQKDITDATFFNPETVVRSCYSAGKTFVAAVIVLAFMYLRAPCKILTTAPTYYQVTDLLWSEINHLFKTRLAPKGFPGNILKTRLAVSDDWFALGISPKDPVNMQGFHQKNILLVFDEAPGVRPDLVEGSEGILASGNAHTLKIGNPIQVGDHFHKDFQSSRIPSKCKIKISAFDTPNFTGEEIPSNVKNGLISRRWVEEREAKWGKNSPLYISKVLADFPSSGVNQIISLELCEGAKRREVVPEGRKEMGVDPARYGDDHTGIVIRQGDAIIDLEKLAKRDTMYIAGKVANAFNTDPELETAKIDVIGIGSGVVDRLLELGHHILPINSAEKAIDKKTYYNRRAEMWFEMAKWLRTGGLPARHPLVDDLIADLTAPRYEYQSDGRYAVESKEKLKSPKRLNHSPDLGDAAVMSIAPSRFDPKDFYAETVSKSADDLLASIGVR